MVRPMLLSKYGWYPENKTECEKTIEKLINPDLYIEGKIPISGICPHAGWYFSGEIAVNVIRILKEKNGDVKNIVIFGGHLSEMNLPILETFEYAETPFGTLKSNKQIIELLKNHPYIQTVPYLQDNTIEILLPIVHYFFGNKITIAGIYLPPNLKIIDILKVLYNEFKEDTLFIGSTDLTHYGPNYGFFHNDSSLTPVEWVKNVNDKNFIELLLKMDEKEAIIHALKNKSACSAGAAVGALLIAKMAQVKSGTLLAYSTSYDKHKNSSFVGYAGILF